MVKKENSIYPSDYSDFISKLKMKIRSSQIKASVSVNREMIRLYWEIGKELVEKQEELDGAILEKVAKDLQNEFPGIEGFSRSNVFRMKAFLRIPLVRKREQQCNDARSRHL